MRPPSTASPQDVALAQQSPGSYSEQMFWTQPANQVLQSSPTAGAGSVHYVSTQFSRENKGRRDELILRPFSSQRRMLYSQERAYLKGKASRATWSYRRRRSVKRYRSAWPMFRVGVLPGDLEAARLASSSEPASPNGGPGSGY
jgi:hypothetical protein